VPYSHVPNFADAIIGIILVTIAGVASFLRRLLAWLIRQAKLEGKPEALAVLNDELPQISCKILYERRHGIILEAVVHVLGSWASGFITFLLIYSTGVGPTIAGAIGALCALPGWAVVDGLAKIAYDRLLLFLKQFSFGGKGKS